MSGHSGGWEEGGTVLVVYKWVGPSVSHWS